LLHVTEVISGLGYCVFESKTNM